MRGLMHLPVDSPPSMPHWGGGRGGVHVMQGRDPGTGPGEKTGSSVEARVTTPLTSGSL